MNQGPHNKKLIARWKSKAKPKKLTQPMVAAELGKTQSLVSQHLKGTKRCQFEDAIIYANLLDTDVGRIWDGDVLKAMASLSYETVQKLVLRRPLEDRLRLSQTLRDSLSDHP